MERKILNIHLNEFNEDSNISEILTELFDSNYKLLSSKKSAIEELETQMNSDIRVFYLQLDSFEGSNYIQLYEVLWD